MKIDSHQHYWHYVPSEYGWISAEMASLKRDRLPPDLRPILVRHGFQGTVAVQARQTLHETRWLLRLAEEYPLMLGVVGWVDLTDPQLADSLEELACHPKLRGVRHVLQDEADDHYMLRESFLRGLRTLRSFNLAYDLLIFPRHLPIACQLASRLPDQRFVLDHMAKPPIREGLLEPWAAQVRRLAAFPNVYCKVSGLITEADWKLWTESDLVPYLDTVFDAFGPQRIMFGSDWPVCTVAGSYAQVVDSISTYVEALSSQEKAAVWGGTASEFYGLEH